MALLASKKVRQCYRLPRVSIYGSMSCDDDTLDFVSWLAKLATPADAYIRLIYVRYVCSEHEIIINGGST
jgi:hypothetical protein